MKKNDGNKQKKHPLPPFQRLQYDKLCLYIDLFSLDARKLAKNERKENYEKEREKKIIQLSHP